MKITRNLWHNPKSAYSKETFCYPGKILFSHRGVDVYKNPSGSWDYVLGDVTITQRAGFRPDGAALIIDDKLDGKNHSYSSDAVADYLQSMGFTPLSYSDSGNE